MANPIDFTKNYTSILGEIRKRARLPMCLNSPHCMGRGGRHAKEIMVTKIEFLGLGDYTRNVGYKTDSITYEFETKTFNYDRGIRLLADVMGIEEAGILNCFVTSGDEHVHGLQGRRLCNLRSARKMRCAFNACTKLTELDFRSSTHPRLRTCSTPSAAALR